MANEKRSTIINHNLLTLFAEKRNKAILAIKAETLLQ